MRGSDASKGLRGRAERPETTAKPTPFTQNKHQESRVPVQRSTFSLRPFNGRQRARTIFLPVLGLDADYKPTMRYIVDTVMYVAE